MNENSEELRKCQITFISEKESKIISKIYLAAEKNPVLIISEKTGMLSRGTSINFLVINEKLRFEISKSNVTSHNLKVSNELLKLASDVP